MGILLTTAAIGVLILTSFGRAQWYLNTRSYLWTAGHGIGAPPPSSFSGTWKQWWLNGALMAEFEVVEGVRHGAYVSWDDHGHKRQEGSYVEGRRHGLWVMYHDNGRKASEIPYKEDMEHGSVKEWDELGNLESSIWKHNGNWVISVDAAGIPANFTGLWKRTGLEGGPEELGVRQGRLDGHFSSWYKSGRRFAEGYLKDGVPDGILTMWNEDGSMRCEAGYASGLQYGMETTWGHGGKVISRCWWYKGQRVSEKQFKEATGRAHIERRQTQ